MQTLQWGSQIMKEKVLFCLNWFFKSFIWLFIVLLGLDIVSKQLVMHAGVEPYSQVADWGIVRINYVLNYNAAFGLGASDHTVSRVIYLIVASLVVIGLITYMIIKRKEMKLYVRACLVLICTGALGNMIDRIFYAPYYAVVDWIDFWWFWGYNFNIADCCIVISAFMLIIYIIVLEVKDMIARRNAEVKMEKDVKTAEKPEENTENEKSE